MEIILLVIIALAEITRLVLSHKPQSKKAHYKQRLASTNKMIWDLEFKISKTKMIREDIREEYDSMNARKATVENQLKNWPKKQEEGERKRLEDQLVLIERDLTRFKAQMEALDNEVYGAKKSNENPDGIRGITQDIESYRELIEMLKDHIKSI